MHAIPIQTSATDQTVVRTGKLANAAASIASFGVTHISGRLRCPDAQSR